MDQEAKKDIISVLTQAIFLIQKRDFAELRELSNHIIHSASIVQDKYSIQTAVIIYALSKILERMEQKEQQIPDKIIDLIHNLIDCLTQDNEQGCDSILKDLLSEISRLDNKLPWHIQRVIEKANIVKGSNMYRHGISIGRAAEILGITQWDLMSYVGKTRIIDKEREVTDIKSRLDFTRRLFSI